MQNVREFYQRGHINDEDWLYGGAQQERKTNEMPIKFYSENLKSRNHLSNLVVDGRIILRRILTFWRRNYFFKF